MAIRTYDILLDSYNSTMPEPIVGRQGDRNGAVTLHVTITDRGTAVNLNGQTINLMAETAQGTAVVDDNAGVTLTEAANGKFDYAIPNALWSESGKITKAYFSLNDTDGQQTTYDLIFIVKKAIDISQDKAEDYITIIDGTLKTLQQKIDAMNTDVQTILDAFNQGDFYNKAQTDSKDAATLTSAKSYTDTQDTSTLASAKSYAYSGDSATLASAKSYTDQYVYSDTGWKNLVMINGFVADPNTPQWRKVGNHVFVRGFLGTPTKGGIFANIPNAAPNQRSGFMCSQGSSNITETARVYVNTDGSLEVILVVAPTKTIQLNSIQYWTD